MRQRWSLFQVVLLALLVGALVAGCGQKTIEKQVAAGPEESLDTKPSDDIMEGRTSGPMLPVYFDFDSSVIRSDQVSRIEKNGEFLKGNPDINIRIEGNCDPRGTNEYNLALGERRAQSAKKYLTNLGVDASRLTTVSWGEEKLLLFGHDELSWAQNRRDDFVIVK